MFEARMGKALLVASAVAGLALIAAPSPGKAASRAYCANYAHQVANDATHRGLIGSVVTLPLDVTGAVVAGRTTYDAQWKHAYNVAYADCRGNAMIMTSPQAEAFAVAPEPEPEAGGSCDFSKYGSWDPTQC